MKINIDCKELARELTDFTCMKCNAEPWQCHECEVASEINIILKENIENKTISIEL